jgi:NAD(P)-dependent dehydrogenase (short-subunit alcohol dehydrogenase family)
MTRGLAYELAPHAIRVAAVAPGDIDVSGEVVDPAEDPYEQPGRQWWERRAPIGRRGTPLDIAYAVAYLASPEASYVTGTTLVVDGGWLSY